MPAPKPATYELRIQLEHITPAIWRTFTVPAHITLRNLNFVIQVVMGWTNSHLHDFCLSQRRFSAPDPDGEGFGSKAEDEADFTLASLLKRPKQHLIYEYDFGDGWVHTITLVKIIPKPCTIPQVLSGEGACPPEDCGGPYGYTRLLECMADPKSVDDPEHVEWMQSLTPDGFDSDVYTIQEVNEILAKGVDALADEFVDLENWGGARPQRT